MTVVSYVVSDLRKYAAVGRRIFRLSPIPSQSQYSTVDLVGYYRDGIYSANPPIIGSSASTDSNSDVAQLHNRMFYKEFIRYEPSTGTYTRETYESIWSQATLSIEVFNYSLTGVTSTYPTPIGVDLDPDDLGSLFDFPDSLPMPIGIFSEIGGGSDFLTRGMTDLVKSYRRWEINGYYHDLITLISLIRIPDPISKRYLVKIVDNTIGGEVEKPCYLDLVAGYKLDDRLIPQQIKLTSTSDKTVAIGFYRQNPYEKIEDLTSIDWIDRKVELQANSPRLMAVEGITLGTLWTDDLNLSIELVSSGSGFYGLAQLIYNQTNTAQLFDYWLTLYNTETDRLASDPPLDITGKTLLKNVDYSNTDGSLKLSTAHNNFWHNAALDNDIGTDVDHPLFKPNNARTFDYHFKPQSDGSFGDLVMDSPRIVELHDLIEQIATALDSEKYSINDVDPALPRVSNLGWHINRLSEVLGIRVDANGVIDRDKEKMKYNPQILNNPQYAEGDYGVTCWGKYGMVIPRLITEYDGSGQIKQPYHVVYDLPQIVRAFQGDIDTALSLQHGTEIRTRDIDGNVGKYPNQLALMLDMHRRTQAIELYSQRSYNLNTVSNAEIRGLYGGLGIPVSQQFINATNLVGKTGVNRKLPYFSYQKGQQTIASRFTTIEVNLGIILGTIMPKSQTEKQKILNPFKRFVAAK
jgi:hypothetical protein